MSTTQLRIAYLPFNVTRVFADASGKFPGGANGVVVVDYDTLMPYVARYMSPNTPASLRDAIAKTELAHFATNIVANLPPDERVPIYLDTNADRLTKTATTFG
jgi:hypothetical protein